ncbi:uncharacterized protein LOC129249148 [Anastrepha obliqua]|uniref:uncharacterized protein LOC129249148 n=1 Tax=Anastrepha obliqua TaxID=95512 RepID=UPI00240A9A5C|nr:uncharacterized protein LOC129249148 [Anastrepha obliqua]
MLSIQLLLLSITFVCYPAFFNRNGGKIAALSATDVGYLEATGAVVDNTTTTTNGNSNNSAAAASELDILMPPIEFTDAIAGIADVTPSPGNANTQGKGGNNPAPNWWHTYDALLVALGMIVMLLVMVLLSHCIWRRHIERRAEEWEAENARIFCSTPYYMDRSQILVY